MHTFISISIVFCLSVIQDRCGPCKKVSVEMCKPQVSNRPTTACQHCAVLKKTCTPPASWAQPIIDLMNVNMGSTSFILLHSFSYLKYLWQHRRRLRQLPKASIPGLIPLSRRLTWSFASSIPSVHARGLIRLPSLVTATSLLSIAPSHPASQRNQHRPQLHLKSQCLL
jgi:hypothetical protein